jgi:hypothetical protein
VDSMTGANIWILGQGLTSRFYDKIGQVDSMTGADQWII